VYELFPFIYRFLSAMTFLFSGAPPLLFWVCPPDIGALQFATPQSFLERNLFLEEFFLASSSFSEYGFRWFFQTFP